MTLLRADRADLLVFAALMVLVVPSLLFLAEIIIDRFSTKFGCLFHAVCLGGLFGLIVWQAVDGSLGSGLAKVILLLSVAAIAVLYLRSRFVQTMAGLMSFATPVVVIAFLFTGPAASVVLPHDSVAPVSGGNGTPVVVVVLDEFPLAAIESAPGRIDRKNFPNFAKLAEGSSWYRNARAVADMTTAALPALVAGKRSESNSAPPDFRQYPDNLFSILDGAGYDVEAVQSLTDLCPHDVCADRGSRLSRLYRLSLTGAVYGHPIPNGGAIKLVERTRQVADKLVSTPIKPAVPSPKSRAETFVSGLKAGSKQASFLHLMAPHIPWNYLPNGQSHLAPPASGLAQLPGDRDVSWIGPRAQVDSSFQQMELQTAFVDREIGRMIRKLKRLGTWDETFFAVVADHGASFEAGSTRRYLTPKNQGWVVPVPMFVKYPGEGRGRPVDFPVNSLDLLPTILAETGIETAAELDGHSLKDAGPVSDDLLAHSFSEGDLTLSQAGVRKAFEAAVRYRNRTFPDGSLFALAGHSNLLGRDVEGLRGLSPLDAAFEPPWPETAVDTELDGIPAHVAGTIGADITDRTPLAISLNGKVAGTMRSWVEAGVRRFAFTLPPDLFRTGTNRVELFEITD